MSDSFNNPTPQFGTAEYATRPGGDRCQFCQQPLGGTYYRVNAAVACPGCAEKMRNEIATDKHAAYVRALTYGIGAAVVGLIGYALIAILLQGWVISYMSIGVGWLVGTAMMKGSNGVGGRRYQIAAALADLCGGFDGGDSDLDAFCRRKKTAETNSTTEARRGTAAVGTGVRTATRAPSGEAGGPGDMAGTGRFDRAGVSVHYSFGAIQVGGQWDC